MNSDGFQNLLRCARDGDKEATAKLLARVRPYLRSVANGFDDPSRASRSASDLVQETELRAWQKIAQFKGGDTDHDTFRMFRVWVARIVRGVALDLARRRTSLKRTAPGRASAGCDAGSPGHTVGRQKETEPAAEESTASARLLKRERAEMVRRAIDGLPDPADRDIVRGFYFDGVSLRESSTRLDLPYHEVKKRYHASMKALERWLQSV